MIRPAGWAVAALLLALAWSPAAASGYAQALDETGRLHRVETEMWYWEGKVLSTALRHTIVNPDGSKKSAIISGTDDVAPDRDPVLKIDPSTDQPVLLWSRRESGGTFDIYLTSYAEGAWTPFRLLPSTPDEDVAPQLQIGFAHDHVVYRSEQGGLRSWNRLVLDRQSLEPVFGPELLPTDAEPIPTAGASYSDTEPPFWNFYFASELLKRTPTDPGIVVVWGVRDDPMPIDYAASFQCPSGIRDAFQPEAGYVAGRFAVRFVSGDKFPYVLRSGGTWSEMRYIELSDKVPPDSARIMLRDMIWRGWIP